MTQPRESDHPLYLKVVRLKVPYPDSGLEAGATGTVVFVYGKGDGFEVEFLEKVTGRTIAVLALLPDEIEAEPETKSSPEPDQA